MKVPISVFLFILSVSKYAISVPLSIQSNLVEFCDTEGLLISKDISLLENGQLSSKTVSLSPKTFAAVCKLKITAPNRHYVVNLQFLDSSKFLLFNSSEQHPPCTMSIYLPDDSTRPFWEGDPCSKDNLPPVDLLPPDFEVVWAPPPNPNHTKGRKFIITAVGKGHICSEPNKHTCLRIGREPIFCVSEQLQCDGIQHCPTLSTKSDENGEMCSDFNNFSGKSAQNSWEDLAQEFVTKFVKKFNNSNANSDQNNWPLMHTKTAPINAPINSPISAQNYENVTLQNSQNLTSILSNYGPWGYLMLGLLICGTVLMFCGLWECCFRKNKLPEVAEIAPFPEVPVLSSLNLNSLNLPPNYEDLDEPPSYNVLFPSLCKSGDLRVDLHNLRENLHNLRVQNNANLRVDSLGEDLQNGGTLREDSSVSSFYSALTFIGDDLLLGDGNLTNSVNLVSSVESASSVNS